MITEKELVREHNPIFETWIIPGTKHKIWKSKLGVWRIWNGDNSGTDFYDTLSEALDAYNRSITPVLPDSAEIIQNID